MCGCRKFSVCSKLPSAIDEQKQSLTTARSDLLVLNAWSNVKAEVLGENNHQSFMADYKEQ